MAVCCSTSPALLWERWKTVLEKQWSIRRAASLPLYIESLGVVISTPPPRKNTKHPVNRRRRCSGIDRYTTALLAFIFIEVRT